MAISIQNSLQYVGLPIIVTSSKPHLNFLIDTGASHNVIFSFVYEGLPNYFKPLDFEKSMYGIEGNVVSNRQVKALIEFENTKAETTFSILDANEVVQRLQNENGFQLHGILGCEFLSQNNWIIDFRQSEILT